MKLRGLNWNGQNLEDWIELWPDLEGVICNLAKNLIINRIRIIIYTHTQTRYGEEWAKPIPFPALFGAGKTHAWRVEGVGHIFYPYR